MPATEDFKAKAHHAAISLRRDVNTYLLARAYAETKRAEVDKIQRQILADDEYFAAKRLPKGRRGPRYRVTEPKDSWLMEEDDAQRYYAKLNAIHLAAGFEDAAKGYCPALVAENLQVQAENVLLESASEELGNKIGSDIYGENRKKMLDLIVGLVVNFPGYVPPEMPKPKG